MQVCVRAREQEWHARDARMCMRSFFCEMGQQIWQLRAYAPLPEIAARHKLSGTPCLTAPARWSSPHSPLDGPSATFEADGTRQYQV